MEKVDGCNHITCFVGTSFVTGVWRTGLGVERVSMGDAIMREFELWISIRISRETRGKAVVFGIEKRRAEISGRNFNVP